MSLHLWACTFRTTKPCTELTVAGKGGSLPVLQINSFNSHLAQRCWIAKHLKKAPSLSIRPGTAKHHCRIPTHLRQNGKKELGRQHASILRPVIDWLTHPYLTINHACTIANAPKLSKQSFNPFPKIKELQTFEQATEHHIIESHPELIFNHYLLNRWPPKVNGRSATTLGSNSRTNQPTTHSVACG